MKDLKGFAIRLDRIREDGEGHTIATFPATYEAAQEAKRIVCGWIDNLFDDRPPDERLESLHRRIAGSHAMTLIIDKGNEG